MAVIGLAAGGWTEIVAMGGMTCQMITVTQGAVLVSVGDPDGDSFTFDMSAHGHRQNLIGPLVPVYARATSGPAAVSVGGVGDETPAFLSEAQAIVADEDEIALGDDTLTLAVAEGVASAVLPGTEAVVHDGDEIAVTGGTVAIAVADGVVTAEFTADP